MALTHTTAARNAATDAVVDLLDVGTTDANGDLVILLSDGTTVVATLALANPAFGASGAAVAGRADSGTITDDTNAVGGTAAVFILRNKDNTEVLRGTIGTSGTDLTISSTNIGAGATVQFSSGITYTALSQ